MKGVKKLMIERRRADEDSKEVKIRHTFDLNLRCVFSTSAAFKLSVTTVFILQAMDNIIRTSALTKLLLDFPNTVSSPLTVGEEVLD